MPRGIPNPANIKRHYFLVSGTVEYVEVEGAPPKTMCVNGVKVSVNQKISVKGLANIQQVLQLNFMNKYSKTHVNPPMITDTIINNVAYLGVFTQAEFHDDEELAKPEKKEKVEKKPELKAVEDPKPEEKPLPVADVQTAVSPEAVNQAVPTKPEAMVVTSEPVKPPLVEVKTETPAPVEPTKTA